MTYDLPEEICVESYETVRVLTLNRPERMNAVNYELHHGFASFWRQLDNDEEARAVVLTGAGDAFSTGADMAWMETFVRDPVLRRRGMEEARRIVQDMVRCPLPVVACVNGPAVGFGCSIALLADIVLMSDDAYFMDSHVTVGLTAADGGALAWPLLTSLLKAKEHLFLGSKISADEAFRLGMANRVVPKKEIREQAMTLAQRLASQPPKAIRDTKRALNLHLERAISGTLEFAISSETECFATEDHLEKIQQFLERKSGRKVSP